MARMRMRMTRVMMMMMMTMASLCSHHLPAVFISRLSLRRCAFLFETVIGASSFSSTVPSLQSQARFDDRGRSEPEMDAVGQHSGWVEDHGGQNYTASN